MPQNFESSPTRTTGVPVHAESMLPQAPILTLSALVLTPSPAAPDLAHAICVTGYEPQRSGVLGDEQPVHFTIEEILRIPSRSYRCPEPGKLAKRFAGHHLCPTRTLLALVGPLPTLCACSDTVRPCHVLQTLVQVVPWPTLNAQPAANLFAPLAASVGSLLVALRPAHPASGTLGHFWLLCSRHVAPQQPCRPAVWQRISSAAQSTAVWQRLHQS
jgi:hypothetical protein